MPRLSSLQLALGPAALVLSGCAVAIESTAFAPTPTPASSLVEPTPSAAPPGVWRPADDDRSCPSPYTGEIEDNGGTRLTPGIDEPLPLEPFSPMALRVDEQMQNAIEARLAEEDEGVYAVLVKRLQDERGAAVNPREPFYAASLYKTAVMIEVYHQAEAGALSLDEEYVVSDYYDDFDLGPGALRHCDTVTIRDALRAMISVSDNTAAVMLQDRVGSSFINAAIESLGTRDTMLLSDDLPTTAVDQALVIEAIARGKAVSRDASQEMLNLLGTEQFDWGIPAGLPEDTLVAHKTGSWNNATHDAGVVFAPGGAYVVVVLSDRGFETNAAGVISDVSRIVYERFEELGPALEPTPAPTATP